MSKDIVLRNGEGIELYPRAYKDHRGIEIHTGLVSELDRTKWDGYDQHIKDNAENINTHVSNTDIHLSEEQRELLNSLYQKVYPIGCVYSSVNDTTPTFEGTVWDPIDTLDEEPTIYRWVRIG